jgi:hypothetical protein
MLMVSAFAKSVRMTNFILLLASFNILLHKLTGSTDPAINTIVSGRTTSNSRIPWALC